MAHNPGPSRGFGPFQPPAAMPPAPYQQPPMAASPTVQTNQACYNCGSAAHWAQYCPEPRRQIPAGSLTQKPRTQNPNKVVKKSNKPVITRYAPPPGYVPQQPPVAGAIPPPPPPPPPQQAGPYQQPQYPAQAYGAQASPVTPQQWQSPQAYSAPGPQWQQQPTAPAYGPHQPAVPQPAYGAYGPQSPYPTSATTQQSPAQQYPQHQPYPTAHAQQQHQQHQPHAAPHPAAQQYQYNAPQSQGPSPQVGYPNQHPQVPYPINTQYPQAVSQAGPYQPPQPQNSAPVPTFTPYVPPPQTNHRGYQQGGSGYQRPHNNFSRQNAHNHHHHHGNNNHNHGGHNNKRDRQQKRGFQQPQPSEPAPPRPPSPPSFFPKVAVTAVKNKYGTIAWKSAQPVDRPLEPLNDDKELPQPVTPMATDESATTQVGSKYMDSEGKPIPVEQTEDMRNDPVWKSIRGEESTRIDMEDYEHVMDEDTEKLLLELNKNLIAEEKIATRGQPPPDSGPDSSNRKQPPNDGKKRNWDEYLVTDKPGQDHERRPNKRRNNENRNRRGNRNNRHGNKQGNRGGNHGGNGPSQGNQHASTNPPPNPPAQRAFHPLPPKPSVGPPPPHHGGDHNGSAKSSYPRPQGSTPRRSTSPDRGTQHEVNYRQRDYVRIKTEDIKSEPDGDAGHPKKIPENADVRRHGSAAMEAYSRRW